MLEPEDATSSLLHATLVLDSEMWVRFPNRSWGRCRDRKLERGTKCEVFATLALCCERLNAVMEDW